MKQIVFLAYLWGIRTGKGFGLFPVFWEFLAYLWGIRTFEIDDLVAAISLFLAYLWGIRTLASGPLGVSESRSF